MDLEAGRKRSGDEDIFVSYHAEDDVQATYAGGLFHNGRNYHVSSYKNNVISGSPISCYACCGVLYSNSFHLFAKPDYIATIIYVQFVLTLCAIAFQGHTHLLVIIALSSSKKSARQEASELAASPFIW